jgi:TusA-related sulfurtransferase
MTGEHMAQHSLDVTGEICPYPLMLTRKEMAKLQVGDRLVVTVDYAKSAEDIPRWAKEEGHVVLAVRTRDHGQWEIVLEKA